MALGVRLLASAAEKTSLGIAMAQCPLQDGSDGEFEVRLLHGLRDGKEARRRRRLAGEILGAFEALAPRRVEYGDGEGGAAGLVDGA